MRRGTVAVATVASFVMAACAADSTTTTLPSTTASAVTSTTTTITSTSTSTTTITSTDTSTTTITSTSASTTATSTTTSTTTLPEPVCDQATAVAIIDNTLSLARLARGGGWTDDTEGAAFADRTNTADEFADHTGFTCAVRLAHTDGDGAQRLAVIGWNERRHAAVIQATDPPSSPYARDATFQLFIEQPRGEFLVDQFVWAATLEGGESIVVATDDYSAALTAKAWQTAAPDLEDLPVTLEVERFAIDALLEVGARNVSVAESASFGYPIGTIHLITPFALGAFAVIGPSDSLDPMVPLVSDGTSTFHDIDGVDVRLTSGLELEMFDLFETGWTCAAHSWRIYASLGSPAEVLEFTDALIRSLEC